MNLNIKTALATALAAITISVSAAAQQMSPTIFDDLPQAFGNTLLDVPPDIISHEAIAPKCGEPTTVRATVKNDPVLSIYKVVKATLYYEAGGKRGETDMKLVDPAAGVWEGRIPAQSPGAKVKYGILGVDAVGNSVAQLIVPADGGKQKPVDAIVDAEDDELEGSLDIVKTAFASDGTNLNFCIGYRRQFAWSTAKGATITALGFYPDDVRQIPAHSITENTSTFAAFIPYANVKGFMRMEDLTKGGGTPLNIESKGSRVCGSVPISLITSKPGRGVKMYSATATFDTKNSAIYFDDASPYSIVYFDGGGFECK